jgi:predicted membrane-bound mannosyltransferase
MGPLVIVLIVVTVLAAACFGRYFDMKRREELAAMAARLGLRFSADKNYGLAGRGSCPRLPKRWGMTT